MPRSEMRILFAFAAMLATTLGVWAALFYGYRIGAEVFGWPGAASFLDLFWAAGLAAFCGERAFSASVETVERPASLPFGYALLYAGIAVICAAILVLVIQTPGSDQKDIFGFIALAALGTAFGAGELAFGLWQRRQFFEQDFT